MDNKNESRPERKADYGFMGKFFWPIKEVWSSKFDSMEKVEKFVFGIIGLLVSIFGLGLFIYSGGLQNYGAKYLGLFAVLGALVCLIEVTRKKGSLLWILVYAIAAFLIFFRYVFNIGDLAYCYYIILAVLVTFLFVFSFIFDKLSLFFIAIPLYFGLEGSFIGNWKSVPTIDFTLKSLFMFLILMLVFGLIAYISNKKGAIDKNGKSYLRKAFEIFFCLALFLFLQQFYIFLPFGKLLLYVFPIILLVLSFVHRWLHLKIVSFVFIFFEIMILLGYFWIGQVPSIEMKAGAFRSEISTIYLFVLLMLFLNYLYKEIPFKKSKIIYDIVEFFLYLSLFAFVLKSANFIFDQNSFLIFSIYLLLSMVSILFGLATKNFLVRLLGVSIFLLSIYKIVSIFMAIKFMAIKSNFAINESVWIMAFGAILLLIFLIYKKLECRSLVMQK